MIIDKLIEEAELLPDLYIPRTLQRIKRDQADRESLYKYSLIAYLKT